MKAIVYTKYGPPDVLQLKEVEKPTPKDQMNFVVGQKSMKFVSKDTCKTDGQNGLNVWP